uniref:Amino acid transporter transmembrane domain-containing protein n=1 Tax=Alexandrium catenella TaxID=2925 RepID=A0A7S1PY89_ALECA
MGNVLKNYPAEGNTAVLLAWMGMAFAVVFTYPLVFTTGRDSLIGLVPALQRAGRQHPTATHVTVTSSLVVLIAAAACTVEDVSLVTGLLGATIGSCLCWIFPASIYLKATVGGLSPELEAHAEPLLPGKGAAPLPKLPTAGGALVAYAAMMVVVGTASMTLGVGKTLGAF